MGFLDKKKNEEWIEGTPESFKVWFWIRLAVSLYVGYIGVDLAIRWIKEDLAWWCLALAVVFVLVAVVFLVFDVLQYVKLRKNLKARAEAEAEAEAEAAGEPRAADEPEKKSVRTARENPAPEGDRELSGIRDFARYVAKEGEDDDEA